MFDNKTPAEAKGKANMEWDNFMSFAKKTKLLLIFSVLTFYPYKLKKK